jgi:hypothetical protein
MEKIGIRDRNTGNVMQCSSSDTVDGDTEKRLAEEEGDGEEERLTEESSSVVPNQTDGGSAESDTGYASMGDTGASEVAQTTLTRTRYLVSCRFTSNDPCRVS